MERAPYPMPDFDTEPPTKPVDVVEREYRQSLADREYEETGDYRIECHAYESPVGANSEKPRGGTYPLNVAECQVISLASDSKKEEVLARVFANTVADYSAAKAHGNPGRDSFKPYGDTTEGEYTLVRIRENVGNKELYIDMKASGGPALLHAHRDDFGQIDFHSGRVTNGCFGASTGEIEKLVNALAGTSSGSLSERVEKANEKLEKQVILTFDRDLEKPITILP